MQVVDLLPAGRAMPEGVVRRWVSAELAKVAALRDLDDQLYVDTDDPVRLDRARRLHAAWRQWAAEAGALLDRIRNDGGPAGARPDVLKLREEVALAHALTDQSPEAVLESLDEARAGGAMTIGEVRRGLRARHHT